MRDQPLCSCDELLVPYIRAAPHNRAVVSSGVSDVRMFENATSLVLAIAAQALAIGVVLAI